MKKIVFIFFFSTSLMAQEALPFREIGNAPQDYTAGNLISRMIEGLGFRYYWATDGLAVVDMAYQPSPDARSLYETLEHIYGLCNVISNIALVRPSVRPPEAIPADFESLRKATLEHLQTAQKIFLSLDAEALSKMEIIFERGGEQQHFPLWNLLNGPLSDALYHTGQVVVFRRSAGNPIANGVNVFLGKKN
jgi:hypothetical protein